MLPQAPKRFGSGHLFVQQGGQCLGLLLLQLDFSTQSTFLATNHRQGRHTDLEGLLVLLQGDFIVLNELHFFLSSSGLLIQI